MTGPEGGAWRAPLALLLGLAVAALPGTVFALLQPQHMQRLALPLAALALLQPLYGLGLLLGALPAASLAGRAGPRRAFLGAVVLVVALSLATALPLELPVLMGLRLLQGAASAGLLVAGLALIRPVFGPVLDSILGPVLGAARLAPGFALAVVAGLLGMVALQMLSGLGMSLLGTPGLALPGLALAAAALLLGLGALPDDPARQRFDPLGALLNLLCLGPFLAALYTLPFRPLRGLVLLALGLIALVLWILQAGRRSAPLLPLDLLARPGLARAAGAALLGGLAITAVTTSAVSRLMAGWELSSEWLQYPLLAAALGAVGGALAAGWRLERPAPAGALLLAACAALLVVARGGAAVALLVMLAFGLGRGLFETGNALQLVGGAPANRGPAAAGLLVAAGALGGVLAPFVTLLLPLLWLAATELGPLDPTAPGLVLAALAALLAAWLSAGSPGGEGYGEPGAVGAAEEMTERVLDAPDGRRRVRIVRRGGLRALVVEERFEPPLEGGPAMGGWRAVPEEASFFADAATAEREARARYPWLGR
ncbi:MFS transporter [Pararoseomonas sp. SCSIO 73927]|uniref:MFS transporter n=1 Tax=Pararoseomonas sp. SCSIO 73927 TaxID=3114537 RepID=UPI0030CFE353